MTIGIPLVNFDETLLPVPAGMDLKPHLAFDAIEALGAPVKNFIVSQFGDNYDFEMAISYLPFEAFSHLTVDEAAKIRISAGRNFSSDIEKSFDADPTHEVLRKIKSSIWRWGLGDARWNEMVEAYNSIRSFDLGVSNFEVTLDFTTSYNEKGPGKHSRTYLDGVFAYLVHYKGQHVMTVGFSIVEGRQLLLQQVQLNHRSGNRWLFRFPKNRIEHLLDCFHRAFAGYRIHLVDGATLADKSIGIYRDELALMKRLEDKCQRYILRGIGNADANAKDMNRYRESIRSLRIKIRHLTCDKPRLEAFYADAGRYPLGAPIRSNDLTHYAVLPPALSYVPARLAA